MLNKKIIAVQRLKENKELEKGSLNYSIYNHGLKKKLNEIHKKYHPKG